MQCTHDQKDANFGLSKMDKQLTYRDAVYYDFLVNHEFQFPLGNIYNHDPIYGKEGTGMTKTNVSDEDFQNYLYMQSTRGITFWELLISDSLMTGDRLPSLYSAGFYYIQDRLRSKDRVRAL